MNSKVTIHLLTDENYHTWANEMKLLLKSKGYWKHIKPEVKSESTTTTTVKLVDMDGKSKDKDLDVEDEKALGLIGLYLTEKFQDLIVDCMTCNEAWWTIKKHFDQLSGSSKIVLLCQLFDAKLKSGESLLQYLDSITRIHKKLMRYGVIFQEYIICGKIISGLSSNYSSIAQSLMQVPENQLTLSYLRQQLALEESRKKLSGEEKHANPQGLLTNPDIKCFRCGRTGHKEKDCYAKLDNPRGGNPHGRGRGNPRGRGRGRGNGNPYQNSPKANANEAAVTFMMNGDEEVDTNWYLVTRVALSICATMKILFLKNIQKSLK